MPKVTQKDGIHYVDGVPVTGTGKVPYEGLKNCPFCNGRPEPREYYYGWYVECTECKGRGPIKDTEASAWILWNNRGRLMGYEHRK